MVRTTPQDSQHVHPNIKWGDHQTTPAPTVHPNFNLGPNKPKPQKQGPQLPPMETERRAETEHAKSKVNPTPTTE